jgi:hypothetical protein
MADEVTLDVFAQDVAKGSKEARLALAKQLKAAKLWTGKVTDKFDVNFYTALAKLDAKYKQQVALDKVLGRTTTATRYDILSDLLSGGGADGTGDTSTTTQTYVTSPTQTAKLLDTVAQDLIGRNLTKAEKAKYTSFVNAAEKKQPTIQTTTSSGTGASSTYTKGGVDEEQLVREKLATTAEAKDYRATDAYTVMMQELGGLR